MFEFLRLLTETALKAIPTLSGRRREKRLRDLGAELFLFYVRVNEALVRGEDIVRSLEMYVRRADEERAQGAVTGHASSAGEWISYKVHLQRDSLAAIGRMVQRWSSEIQVLDGRAYAALQPLLFDKFNALDVLLGQLGANKMVLDLGDVLDRYPTERDPHADRRRYDDILYARAGEIRQRAIELDRRWGPETYATITAYLTDRDPRSQLAAIRESLEQLRTALLTQFPPADLLLQVGDKRFEEDWNGQYFW